jgi:protein-tyrosine-phosphatase
MAEAFTRHLSRGKVESASAGTMPSPTVNLMVVKAMREKGIDLSKVRPKLLTQQMLDSADRVITMGCSVEELCPAGVRPMEDWGLEDPHGKPLRTVRRIRDEVEVRVKRLLTELNSNTGGL